MAMERKRLELVHSGFDAPSPVRGPAAPGRAQTLPPLPRAPEFLNKKNSLSANTYPQDIPVAGPSSKPLDEPVPKESPSAKPSPPPPFIFPSAPRRSERPRETPATSRFSCEGWNISELCRNNPNFHEVRRVKASVVPEGLSRIMDEYENVGKPLIIEGWDEHPCWESDLLNLDWLLAEVKDKGAHALLDLNQPRRPHAAEMHVRNVHDRRDYSMTLPAFVEMCRKQAVYHEPGGKYQRFRRNNQCSLCLRRIETVRCYWKDAECPSQWKEWLGRILPAELLP